MAKQTLAEKQTQDIGLRVYC